MHVRTHHGMPKRSVGIVALKSLRSHWARPKTTGKFYFQIKISFAQKRFRSFVVAADNGHFGFFIDRWTVAWATGPTQNNIHRIGSTIVNQRTISEMKIKIYCLRCCCVVLTAAHHSAPRMCLRFCEFYYYYHCCGFNIYSIRNYERNEIWCVVLMKDDVGVCASVDIHIVRSHHLSFFIKILKRRQKTMPCSMDAGCHSANRRRRNEFNFNFISSREYRTKLRLTNENVRTNGPMQTWCFSNQNTPNNNEANGSHDEWQTVKIDGTFSVTEIRMIDALDDRKRCYKQI